MLLSKMKTSFAGRFAAVLVTACASAVGQLAEPQQAVVVRAARMLDVRGGRMVAPGEVLVIGDRIAEVGQHVTRPAGVQVIDLGDRTLMPGMVDAHVHLFLHPGAEDLQTVEGECAGADADCGERGEGGSGSGVYGGAGYGN